MINSQNDVKILYVEDEDDVREGYARALERISSELYTAKNGEEGLALYKKHLPDIVISDIKMPIMSGVEMVKAIREINLHAYIIFTTAHSESAYLLEAIELHAEGYLLKPVEKKTLVALIKKLSKSIKLERENEDQKNILQHIIDSENNITLIVDVNTIYFASKSFLSFFNFNTIGEFYTKNSSVLDLFLKTSEAFKHVDLTKTPLQKGGFYDLLLSIEQSKRILTLEDKDANEKSFFINASHITETKCLLTFTDITQIEQERQENNKKATTDALTGIYNRHKLEEIFEYEISRIARHLQPLSLAIVDIDHFKVINDQYGHLIGDEVLIMLTQNMRARLRQSDTFARWGGEEFVLLFSNTNIQEAYICAEKFRQQIESLEDANKIKITASFGITSYKEGDTLTTMLERADRALYDAKNSGRNCTKSCI
ncbi:MAG: diguanylate cyclase [Sulfurimonas sp.]|nr:diguanylate cyclase [Sulfurimonas sp.]